MKIIYSILIVAFLAQSAVAQENEKAAIESKINAWLSAWSPGETEFDAEKFRTLFVPSGNVTVVDNTEGHLETINTMQTYDEVWSRFMAPMRNWKIERTTPIEFQISSNLALTSFQWKGGEQIRENDALRISAFVTHGWKKLGNEWFIYHEHITAIPAQ